MKTTHEDTPQRQPESPNFRALRASTRSGPRTMLIGLALAIAAMIPFRALAAAPAVDNATGASNVLSISAVLNGTLTSTGGVPTQASVYWGRTDGGTTFGSWGHTNGLGTNAVGPLSVVASSLLPSRTYYYRFYATNVNGQAWAGATTNFQTPASVGPAPVILGSTAHFTILAGAAVTAGPGLINGDVGASPIAGSAIGIPPAQVNGIIYKADASGPAGANVVVDAGLLTTAKGDLTIAYNDAAGRTPIPTGPFLNPGAGNIGGLNLVPGLYKFTSEAHIEGFDVTLTGGPDDVWIFQVATALKVEAGVNRSVILAGGARAKNIFWQVGTSATLGTYSVFKGTIIADQSITLDVGSTMEGRALAFAGQVAFAGDGGSLPTVAPAKAISPSPTNSATGQSISTNASWQNGGGATSYDVYFGTNSTPGDAEFQGNQIALTFAPGILGYGITNYWRIDAKNSGGTTPGDVWSFATLNPPSSGTVQFGSATNGVAKDGVSIAISVTRQGGNTGAASVSYATLNGTATAGLNYTATNGMLNWADGDAATKTFTVPILNDNVYGANKTFTATLSGAVGASLGSPVSTTVTIVESGVQPPTTVQITIPTVLATYLSLTNSPNLGGTASDYVGVTKVTLRNNRDVADYTATGTDIWSLLGLPLFQGTNYLDATAFTAAGGSVTGTVQVTYNGDLQYDDVLRSGGLVQEITFPDNLTPGQIVTTEWKILSYVPVSCRVYAGVPGGWTFFKNGTFKGVTESTWNINGRHASIYSIECSWPVPQKSGDFDVWFNVAQTDNDQFMIPIIPDGVDPRPDPSYPKLFKRTVLAGGSGVSPASDLDNWDSARSFETVDQHKERSGTTITAITMPDNLTQGAPVTCQWKVQSYMDINGQVLVLNLAQQQVWLTTNATVVGIPVDTSFYFQDRTSGTKYYAKEYTFQATFPVPAQPGDQRLFFRNQDSANTNAQWMAGNLAAGVDPRQAQYNGMYGRFIERTINP